jgi:hypothetical protein
VSGDAPESIDAIDLVDHGEAIYELRNALAPEQCQAIIDAFEAEPRVRPGVVRRPDGREEVDPTLKRSTDFLLERDVGPGWMAVDQQLAAALHRGIGAYVRRYAWLPRLPTTFCAFQIQRTLAGEGFDWHADEDGRRRLALIFYLNDDFEGGGTEFEYQRVTITPRRGSLLLFPPYWTHVHRGQPVVSGRKYIVTSFLLHQDGGA